MKSLSDFCCDGEQLDAKSLCGNFDCGVALWNKNLEIKTIVVQILSESLENGTTVLPILSESLENGTTVVPILSKSLKNGNTVLPILSECLEITTPILVNQSYFKIISPSFKKNRLEHRPTYYILKDNYRCTVSYIVVNSDDCIEWRIDTAK